MDSYRAFIAIDLDSSAATVLSRLLREMKSKSNDVRWTRPDQLHMTLKFLGDIDNRELPQFCASLREACRGVEPFSITLNGLGAFPKNKPPRVIWVAVDEGKAPLQELNCKLDAKLAALGIPGETRAFTPHLTLGRVARGANLAQLQATMDAADSQLSLRCDINEIKLLASLKEDGKIVYEPLDVVELG